MIGHNTTLSRKVRLSMILVVGGLWRLAITLARVSQLWALDFPFRSQKYLSLIRRLDLLPSHTSLR